MNEGSQGLQGSSNQRGGRIFGRFSLLMHPSIPEDNMRYKLITLAAAAIASSATAAAAKERIVDVTTLDVAGVRLGMFPDEARIGLEAAGFKVDRKSTRLNSSH